MLWEKTAFISLTLFPVAVCFLSDTETEFLNIIYIIVKRYNSKCRPVFSVILQVIIFLSHSLIYSHVLERLYLLLWLGKNKLEATRHAFIWY